MFCIIIATKLNNKLTFSPTKKPLYIMYTSKHLNTGLTCLLVYITIIPHFSASDQSDYSRYIVSNMHQELYQHIYRYKAWHSKKLYCFTH